MINTPFKTACAGGIAVLLPGMNVHATGDPADDAPITVRDTWRSVDHDHARWTRALPTDHGKTCETNGTMDFVPTADSR